MKTIGNRLYFNILLLGLIMPTNYITLEQAGGPTLGYSPESGVELIQQDGLFFKDFMHTGELLPYEDWRLSAKERAIDLASRLSIEEIAGLMLYSAHQPIHSPEVTEAQYQFLTRDHVRHILVTQVASPRVAAEWNNHVQALLESLGHGIPANNSSDPRNYTLPDGEYNAGSGGDISHWPREIGLGATFDMDLIRHHGEIASAEYRALGICTALSPQVDIATDPRWRRFYGTFGEDPGLNAAIAEAYCDAFQTTPGSEDGWGIQSVNAMVKHWPGGGSGEGGRDAHFCFGKYAVYPGGAFDQHLRPFTEGAFRLKGKTQCASAVMPYYTISYGMDPSGQNLGNNFSHYIIRQLLRNQYGYEGVVCTDWGVTHPNPAVGLHSGKPWGVEEMSEAERHLQALRAGVDQFGGNNAIQPVLEAYQLWVEAEGEASARRRFEASAVRLLVNIFHCGLFENPYVSPDSAEKIVGQPDYMTAGYEAQLKSIVMVKNTGNVLRDHTHEAVQAPKTKIYVPIRHYPASRLFFGGFAQEQWRVPVERELLEQYFDVVDTPEEADMCLCMIHSPEGDFGYSIQDAEQGGNGYIPISLQYEDYTASDSRAVSIAGGDPKEKDVNRSYLGKSTRTYNRDDMVLVQQMHQRMAGKPVICVIETDRPFVLSGIEPYADAILLTFGVTNQAVLDIVSGRREPYALLPFQMPANMLTVEHNQEDVPGDLQCYTDDEGHVYDFAYGLDWQGIICDERTKRWRR